MSPSKTVGDYSHHLMSNTITKNIFATDKTHIFETDIIKL